MIGLFEYFQLWDVVHVMALSQVEDDHIWRLDGPGTCSAKSAYTFEPACYRNLGHLLNAWSFCGSPFAIDAGQQTTLLSEVFLTRPNARYVIRERRAFSIWSQAVSSRDRSGSRYLLWSG